MLGVVSCVKEIYAINDAYKGKITVVLIADGMDILYDKETKTYKDFLKIIEDDLNLFDHQKLENVAFH